MLEALNKKGYNAYSLSVSSQKELLTILGLAVPVFVTLISKVTFLIIRITLPCLILLHGSEHFGF